MGGKTDLFALVQAGDLAALSAALAANPHSAMARDGSGTSLLSFAVYAGKPDAVALIRGHRTQLDAHEAIIVGDMAALEQALAEGFDGNARAPDGFTPLALAAFFRNRPAFDRLLPLTQDINAAAENPQRVAAIHAATAVRDSDMVAALLKAGADPNQVQADGFTPLQAAAQHGDAVIAGLLLLFGADPAIRNGKGMTAADHAREGGHAWLAERIEART
jgi:uncharacterized protein